MSTTLLYDFRVKLVTSDLRLQASTCDFKLVTSDFRLAYLRLQTLFLNFSSFCFPISFSPNISVLLLFKNCVLLQFPISIYAGNTILKCKPQTKIPSPCRRLWPPRNYHISNAHCSTVRNEWRKRKWLGGVPTDPINMSICHEQQGEVP